MATAAQWEQLIAVSLRSGVNLAASSGSNAPTILSTASSFTSGLTPFQVKEDGSATSVYSYGIPTDDWQPQDEVFGVPVTNRPIFDMGQEINEYNKLIGSSVPTGGTGYNFLRGIQAPTTTIEFDFERYTALPFLYALFQRGAPTFDDTDTDYTYTFSFPDISDGSTSNYYLTLAKSMEALSGGNLPSEVISDGIATSMTLSGAENEPFKASFDIAGYKFTNMNMTSTQNGIVGSSAIALGFAEADPLHWNDVEVVIQVGSAYYIVEASSFELTVTANFAPRRYNSKYPIRFVNNGYTVEGNITIPYGATGVGGTALKNLINTTDTSVSPTSIDLFWLSSSIGDIGSDIASSISTKRTLGTTGDFRIRINAIPRSVPDTDEDETMLNLSFTGADVRSDNTISSTAMELVWYEDDAGRNYLGERTANPA